MPIPSGGQFTPDRVIASPGVFSREIDQSGIAQGVADIGAVIVAPFPKGPGFSPTLLTNLSDLEDKFGVADGVYYGPYTAAEYLKEKGMVTVCRVGGLTGYKQNYPFIIWGMKGSYNRAPSAGAFVSGAGLIGSFVTASSIVQSGSNLIFTSPSFEFQMQSGAADEINRDETSNSGSLLYSGQQIVLLNGSNLVAFSWWTGSGATSIADAMASASFTGSFDNPVIINSQAITFGASDAPFQTIYLLKGKFYTETGSCRQPLIHIKGIISGSFGPYDGTFTADGGTPVFDPCTFTWSSSVADWRVLAVLNNTQYDPVQDLIAPGFSGSSMDFTTPISGASNIVQDYNLTLKSTNSNTPYGVYQFSLNEDSTKYITNVFGNNPLAGDPHALATGQKIEAAYLYKVFENAIKEVNSDPTKWYVSGSWGDNPGISGDPLNFTDGFSRDLNNNDSTFALTNAFTPWVISQKIAPWQTTGSSHRFRLFRVATMSDGDNMNTSYKIEISNVKLAGKTVSGTDWGTFTLTVRAFSDTDKKTSILENFTNLNLDPDSSNYIARRIGDRYNLINNNGKILEYGTFTNNSKYIRIEMNGNPVPVTAVPYGFEAYAVPFNSSIGQWAPTMKYTKASIYGQNPGKYPSGITFDDAPPGADAELASLYPTTSLLNGASLDNREYMAPLPEFGAYSSVGNNINFALDDVYTSYGVNTGSLLNTSLTGSVPAIYDALNETTYVKMRKFVFGFQGGFNGIAPSIPINVGGDIEPGNTQGLDCTNINSAGSIAYKQCIAALSNPDEFDVNLIASPGIIHQHHPYVTNLIVETCENRGDVFYILDLYVDDGNPSAGQIDEVVNYASEYDTNYAGAYYPWVKILDTNTNKIITVPPSVIMPAVFAENDKVSAEWFAPAGLNRGIISIAVQVTDRTTQPERDILYEGKVNPIAAFPGTGIAVWGQKTLQTAASALDRINVRRLLINLKKFFRSSSKWFCFEQNVSSTRNKILSILQPYMESVQQRNGIFAFFIKLDEETNTADVIDRNMMYGKVALKPTKTSEFIIWDFMILPTGQVIMGA
jgi:hypothetical protein